MPAVGTVHVKAPTFDESSHWATYLYRIEAAACTTNWTEKDLSLIHICLQEIDASIDRLIGLAYPEAL